MSDRPGCSEGSFGKTLLPLVRPIAIVTHKLCCEAWDSMVFSLVTLSHSHFLFKQVPLEEGLNKAIHYFRKELEYQANNQYIPKPKPARIKKGRTRHN